MVYEYYMKITNKEDYLKLLKIAKDASDNYYNNIDNGVVMSDYEFDLIGSELIKYETTNKISGPDAFINTIGSRSNSKEQYTRTYPMTSLSNTYNVKEAEDWIRKTSKFLSDGTLYHLSPKLDGLSLCITKKDGKVIFSTRGDGIKGNIVTSEYLYKICKVFIDKMDKLGDTWELRGELFLDSINLKRLNEIKTILGEPLYSSRRNAASGIVSSGGKFVSYLTFAPWGVCPDTENKYFKTVEGMYNYLYSDLDFKGEKDEIYKELNSYFGLVSFSNLASLADYYNNIYNRRDNSSIPTDGVVININTYEDRKKIGGVSKKYPLYATSLKFPPTIVKTRLINVIYDIGRTGVLSPVGIVDTVDIDGVKISKVTLHNLDYIEKKGLKLNDEVGIIRSGDVIPKIIWRKETPESKKIGIPKECPSCGSRELILKDSNSKILMCTNDKCTDVLASRLVYFTSKQCTDISGLGIELAKELIEPLYLEDVSNIYIALLAVLNYDTDSKKINTFIKNIKKRQATLNDERYRILAGMGIEGLGVYTAMKLEKMLQVIDVYSEEEFKRELYNSDIKSNIADIVMDNYKYILETIKAWCNKE